MERKLGGLLLTIIGIAGLAMAYVNLMEIISNSGYGNTIYNVGDKGASGIAVMGYGVAGLVLIFLGIKQMRRQRSL